MSQGLNGFPDCIFYQYHFVGGPRDGEVSTGFRPYFRLKYDDCVYEAKNYENNGHVEWIDDGTRKIELYFVGMQEGGSPAISRWTEQRDDKYIDALMKVDRPIREPDKIRKFFDPHPGFAGAAAPIPQAVREIANQLNGTQDSLRSAVDLIQNACPKGVVEAHEDHQMITLRLMDGGLIHSWRVIKFE